MAKYKVGDKIIIKECIGVPSKVSVGDTAIIEHVSDKHSYTIRMDKDNDTWRACDTFIKFNYEGVNKKMKFKIGDKVEVIDNGFNRDEVEIGDTAVITSTDMFGYMITMDKDGYNWSANEKRLKLVDKIPEQIKVIEKVKLSKGVMADFIQIGSITIAIPKDAPIGISCKHEDDEQNDEVGQAIASDRMLKDAVKKGVIKL